MNTNKLFLGVLLCLGVPLSTLHAQEASPAPSYQCMALKNNWNGQGAMPPPVAEYAGPSSSAASVGIAMSTLIVDDPPSVVDNRIRVFRPNGTAAWIDNSQVTTWHVASNPSAVCSVVRLPNGSLRTTSH
jgi:hypothetical protein